MNLTVPSVYVDTETGGLRVKDRPWEVALVTEDPDGKVDSYVFHVSDFRPADADPGALRMNRFYDRHPAWTTDPVGAWVGISGPDLDSVVHHEVLPEAEVATRVEHLTRGRLVIACNPGFDMERHLAQMLDRHGCAPTWFYRPICATTYAAGRLGLPPGPWKNESIGEQLGVPRDPDGAAHTALADAHYARALLAAAYAHGRADV